MRELIDQIVNRSERGETVALCAVVRTRGSTPQEKGALMLVTQDGKTLGTLGGGCVEAEVRSRALKLMHDRDSRLLSFKLDHDYGWDDGLVCGGTMDIAVQIVDPQSAPHGPWRTLQQRLIDNQPATVPFDVPDEAGAASHFEIDIAPTPTLVIAGGGHVGLALFDIAKRAGFHLAVIDDRPDFAAPARFPGATCIVGEIEDELARYPIDEHTYIVIVTRGHRHDGKALGAVIGSRAKYIGLIGSKRKIHTILEDLHRQGATAEQLANVHAPIGLDIAAVTPGEIAVSIAAELIAVRRGALNGPIPSMRVTPDQLKRWLDRAPAGDATGA